MAVQYDSNSIREKGIVVLFILLLAITSFFSAEWSKWVQALVLICSFLFTFLLLRKYGVAKPTITARNLLKDPHTYLIAWVAIGAIGILFSINWYNSLSYWFLIVSYVLLYFSAYRFFRDWRYIIWLSRAAVGIGIFGAVAGLVLFVNQSESRLNGLLFNANAISGLFIVLLPLAAIFWLQAERRLQKIVWGSGVVVMIIALALTYSYTAWVSSIIPLYLLVRKYRRRILTRRVLMSCLTLVIVGFMALVGFRYGQSRDFSSAIRIHETISYTHFINSFSQRLYFVSSAAQMAIDHPIIGSGLSTYQDLYARYAQTVIEQPRYAHNYYVQALAELGVVGGAALIIFVIVAGRRIVSVVKREANEQRQGVVFGIALGVLASATHAVFDFSWHFSLVFILFWLFVGILLAWGRRQAEEQVPSASAEGAPSVRGYFLSGVISSGVLLLGFAVLVRGLTVFMGAYIFDSAERQALRGEFESAFVSYEQGLQFDPDSTVFTNYVGLAVTNFPLVTTDQRNAMKQRLESLASNQTENYRVHWMLGRYHIAQKEYAAAIEPLARAAELNPVFLPDIFYDLAFAHYSLQQYDAAAQVLLDFLDTYYPGIQTSNPNLRTQLAAIHFLLGEIAQAEGLTQRAAYYYGMALSYDSRFEAAVTALKSLSGNL